MTSTKSFIPASTSKLTSLAKAKEAAEECLRKELEASSARKKKEAILEAKKEAQKRFDLDTNRRFTKAYFICILYEIINIHTVSSGSVVYKCWATKSH